ncbi:hypothetical protein QTP88_012950 [Uroleucon formosanum]
MDNAVLAVGFIIYVTICFALISQVLTLNEDFASSWSDVSLYVMIGMRKLSASYNLIHGGLIATDSVHKRLSNNITSIHYRAYGYWVS